MTWSSGSSVLPAPSRYVQISRRVTCTALWWGTTRLTVVIRSQRLCPARFAAAHLLWLTPPGVCRQEAERGVAGEGPDRPEIALVFGEDGVGPKVTAQHHLQCICKIQLKITVGPLHSSRVEQTLGSDVGEYDSPGGSVLQNPIIDGVGALPAVVTGEDVLDLKYHQSRHYPR